MVIARYTQTSTETKNYRVDYSAWLGEGETIDSVVASVTPITPAPLVVSASVLVSLTDVSLVISGGEPDTDYVVQIAVTTSAAQVKEDCIEMGIVDSCV